MDESILCLACAELIREGLSDGHEDKSWCAGVARLGADSEDVDMCLLCFASRGQRLGVCDRSEKTDIAVTAQLSAAATSGVWTNPSFVWHVLN
jgi:hypothetical protein